MLLVTVIVINIVVTFLTVLLLMGLFLLCCGWWLCKCYIFTLLVAQHHFPLFVAKLVAIWSSLGLVAWIFLQIWYMLYLLFVELVTAWILFGCLYRDYYLCWYNLPDVSRMLLFLTSLSLMKHYCYGCLLGKYLS